MLTRGEGLSDVVPLKTAEDVLHLQHGAQPPLLALNPLDLLVLHGLLLGLQQLIKTGLD